MQHLLISNYLICLQSCLVSMCLYLDDVIDGSVSTSVSVPSIKVFQGATSEGKKDHIKNFVAEFLIFLYESIIETHFSNEPVQFSSFIYNRIT